MTILDPRLLPLIETLSAAGLDWLSFELVDAVRRGREVVESEDVVASARAQVRSGEGARLKQEAEVMSPKPILGDDQVAWAAEFVAERLDGAIADLAASISTLNDIADEGRQRDQSARPIGRQSPAPPVTVALAGEDLRDTSADDVGEAQAAMQKLRLELARWSQDTRGGLLA